MLLVANAACLPKLVVCIDVVRVRSLLSSFLLGEGGKLCTYGKKRGLKCNRGCRNTKYAPTHVHICTQQYVCHTTQSDALSPELGTQGGRASVQYNSRNGSSIRTLHCGAAVLRSTPHAADVSQSPAAPAQSCSPPNRMRPTRAASTQSYC